MKMEPRKKGVSWLDAVWVLACLVGSSGWCLSCAQRVGPTFDEPTYLARGLNVWRGGSHRPLMELGTMPLAVDLQTLPLYLWESWRGAPIDTAKELLLVLPWARAGTLFFWWLLLLYAWLVGRTLGGIWGGRLAVAWMACEPNLLGHASLATTDLAFAACLLAYLYHFRAGRSQHWMIRVGIPALWCSATVLAKASAIVFGPICVAVIELERLAAAKQFAAPGDQRGRGWRAWARILVEPWKPFGRDFTQISLLTTLLVFVYCGSDWQAEESFVRWSHALTPGPAATAMVWVSEHLTIFSNAGEAVVRQIKHNINGHAVYLLGYSNPRGSVWYYFPLLMLIKLTLPALLAMVLFPLAARRRTISWPLLCGAALLLWSFTFRVQIGIRLILPVIVLLTIGASVAAARLLSFSRHQWRRNLFAVSSTGLLGWGVVIAILAWPHGLLYVNPLWGGEEQGYLRVSDSNYDWGQSVPELLAWQRRRGLSQLDVWYFGTDPRVPSTGLRLQPLHMFSIQRPRDVLLRVPGRYLAVSATLAYGGYLNRENASAQQVATRFIRSQRPVQRVGAFLIYDLSQHPDWASSRGEAAAIARGEEEQLRLR